ncbi:MAG: dihydrofolate reductase [Rhizobiales bacterium]|nr:dihydrofolate reductase [Hyphomicrobiales bacterium]
MSRVAFVVAVARNGVIGDGGMLPWRIPSDLKRFKAITMGKPAIMGRKTWESLKIKPLPGRTNIVVTRNSDYRAEGALVVKSPEEALRLAELEKPEEICVIGGGEIYELFLPYTSRVYLTEVDLAPEGDTRFMPLDPMQWRETSREHFEKQPGDDAGFVLRTLDRAAPERQY